MCQYVGYFTENYLVIKSNLCPSNIFIFIIIKAVSPFPLSSCCLLAVEDNNQILDTFKFKLLIFLDIAVAAGMQY